MNTTFWLIFDLVINIFQGCISAYFLFGCLKYKHNKFKTIKMLLCGSTVAIALIVINKLVFFENVAIFIYGIILFVYSLIFLEGGIFKRIFCSIMPVNAMAMGSMISTNLCSFFFKRDMTTLLTDSNSKLCAYIISNLVLFAILFTIQRISVSSHIELGNSEWVFMLMVLCLSIVAFMFMFFALFEISSFVVSLYLSLAVIVLVLINITIYVLLIKLSKKHIAEAENAIFKQQYLMQTKLISESKKQYESAQKQRHDLHNTLLIISGLNANGKTDEIDTYISQYIKEHDKIADMVSIKNDYINAVMNSKIIEASQNGIKVEINTISDIQFTNIIDFCNLLGNMFDNAVAGCENCVDSKLIKLFIGYEHQNIIVTIKNTIPSSVIAVNPELKTNKKDKSSHGYGTKIIREIAKKHNGFADFYEDEDGMFCCNVIMNAR